MNYVSPEHLRSIKTLPQLLAYLRDELDWPIEAGELDELTFDWSADQLLVSDSQARRLTAGVIRQLRPLTTGQPWGIFVVEFADDTFRCGALREILRGLVANRRRNPTLPSWQHKNLLFICATRDYDRITFAHYRGEQARKARLALFGWQCGSSYLRTLCEFNLPALRWPEDAADTSAWLKQWAAAFDKEPLTKEFYREISNWYFWTLKNCQFPKDAPKEADGYDHISVIRLITRLIFCWFIREKGLIPDALFDERKLAEALLEFDPGKAKNKDSVFYRAILQNLFFATLNTEMDKRGWAKEDQNFMVHNLYRHKEYFRKPGEALALFKNIPFLNGGLFECLDKDFGENAKPRYLRIDGFSRRPDSQPVVPDFLFFGPEQEVDLSKDYGDKKFRKVRVRGLINTLNHYKFTIEENTPFDQEVALDPELCGKVFENLLAAYNPETGTTARKATGSFYTPREIVDYMVDESLVAFLNGILTTENKDGTEKKIRQLLDYTDEPHEFNEAETEKLIDAIDHLKALDPAVGSGAFPMGILHKLVHVLKKLDPRNEKWKERQIRRVRDAITTAGKIEDADIRERTIKELETQIDGINDAFEHNELDYGRKLFLIENCIYGVDIQPIAVQIAKMRFFISLIVDQKVDMAKPNLSVRALPNLETKFVAANTLIGIHRPAQMLLRNPAIDKKEAELRQVREKHFNAKTSPTKEKYREQDKKLRAEIADLLKTDGWDDKTAKQLAAWDPYDQNASAGFFDPEWMFGITSGFDVVIGNPPYLESRHPSFSDNLKQRLQSEVAIRWQNDSQFITRGADLLIYFYETSLSFIKATGNIVLITQNAWLDTEYGKRFQSFLRKNTFVRAIIDSDFKYFNDDSGPNINTVVSVFDGRKPAEKDSITFARVHENLANANYSLLTAGKAIDPAFAEIHRYPYSHPLLSSIKWGILLVAPDEFLHLLVILQKKASEIGKIIGHHLVVGQGLNLTHDHFIAHSNARDLGIQQSALIQIFTSDDGAPFVCKATKNVLVNREKISVSEIKNLQKHGFSVFDPNRTTKSRPILILPRGLGRHFCAFNDANSYSASCVDVYDVNETSNEEMRLNLWASLNSSVCWLYRELSGRKNLGGGMLKAEAVDLETMPIYMKFNETRSIQAIFKKLKEREAFETIAEIDSEEHRRIDSLTFDYLGISSKDGERIITILKSKIYNRGRKSET